MMFKRFFLIGLLIFSILYIQSLFAELPEYLRFTQSVDKINVQRVLDEYPLEFEEGLKASEIIPLVSTEGRRKYSNSILQKLYEYRLEIQENAYATTMKLCPAYRIAKGMGLPEYHQKLGESRYVDHESFAVRNWARNMNDEYGTTLSSSLQGWLYVMYEGATQPLSAIGGVKADWLNITHTSMLEIKSWFYSFYILYLTDSLGFVQGIMHCLGTTDADEINQFIYTVLAVDLGMSSLGYALTFWTGDKILRLIINGLRWSFRPLGRSLLSFLHRKNISPTIAKRYAALAGVSLLGGFGLWLTHAIRNPQEVEEFSQEFFQIELERVKNKQ